MRDGRYVVVIVDDHALFAQGLALLLESRAGDRFAVAGSVTTGEDAVALVGRERADIAIIDLTLPLLGGVETIRRVAHAYPATASSSSGRCSHAVWRPARSRNRCCAASGRRSG